MKTILLDEFHRIYRGIAKTKISSDFFDSKIPSVLTEGFIELSDSEYMDMLRQLPLELSKTCYNACGAPSYKVGDIVIGWHDTDEDKYYKHPWQIGSITGQVVIPEDNADYSTHVSRIMPVSTPMKQLYFWYKESIVGKPCLVRNFIGNAWIYAIAQEQPGFFKTTKSGVKKRYSQYIKLSGESCPPLD